jgi:N6-adenosine-specific RNA methylase IME4
METNDKITGYSIYNRDAKQRIKYNTLEEIYPPLPNKKYDIIYADPPWDYNGKMQFDKTSTTTEKLNLSRKIFISSATFKYPTLKIEELMKLPLYKIMKDDCLLFMWTTNPQLENAIELGKAWGFDFKTVAFIWNKMIHNPGQYTLSNCELCLVFKHGKIPRPRGARNIQQLVSIPRQAHSVKPIEVLNGITAMFPTQKKIELFARRKNNDWDSWGLDIAKFSPEEFELEQERT